MARILNLEAYPLATTISDDSYLVGTDATDNKETKNFKIEDLKTHILPDPLTEGVYFNATVTVDADGQISSVAAGSTTGLGLTTNFTSGAATLIGNTLNIPVYDTGEINTASNVGGGSELFKQKVGSDLEFRTLGANPNISITQGSDTVSIGVSGVALVGTYTDGYVPRWNATTNTLESGKIRDDGSTVSISSNTANIPANDTDLSVSAGLNNRAIKVNQSWGPNEAARINVTRTDLGASPTTAPVTGLFIDAKSGKEAAGDFKHIKLTTELSIAPRTTPKTIDNVFGIQLSDYSAVSSVTANNLYQIYLGDIDALTKGTGEFYGIYQKETSIKNYLAGNVGIGTTPVTSKTLAVGGNSIISGQLDLNGSGDSKLKLINYLDPTTGEENSNYMTWYKSDNTTRRGYLGFTDENTFRINVQESPDISQIILDADEVILNSTDETQSGTIKSGVWEATPIADAYIAEDYVTATTGAAQRLAVFDGTDSIEGDDNLTYTGSTLAVNSNNPASPNNKSTITGNYFASQVETNDANCLLYGYGDSGSFSGELILAQARGTIDSPTPTLINNILGEIQFAGATGAPAHRNGALIKAQSAEDFVVDSNLGTILKFQTVSLATSTLADRYTIDGNGDHNFNGNVGIGTDPDTELHIKGAGTILKIETTNATGNNLVTFNDSAGQKGYIGYASGASENLTLLNDETGELSFFTTDSGNNTTRALTISSDQDVSVDNGNLEVNGNVKVDGQAYSAIQSASTPTTAQTIDWDDGNVAIIDLGSATSNVTLTLSNPKAGASYFIKIVQGAGLYNIIFPTSVKFAGETAPYELPVTATDNAIDAVALTCISDSGTVEYLANCSKNYG